MEYLGINLDLDRDSNFSEEGLVLLERYYAKEGRAGVQKAIARVANCFSFGDKEFAQRVYDGISQHRWFPSSPIFSNATLGEWVGDYWKDKEAGQNIDDYWQGPRPKAMPIACFLAYLEDSIKGQVGTAAELSYLSVMGGGTAVHSKIRATSEKAPGPIPYIKTLDGVMGYYRQGETRRGSTAIYLDISHPDIPEFITMRHPSGGDSARKIDNRKGVHLAINLTDEFQEAVDADKDWTFRCPHTGEAKQTVKARELWESILDARELTGEPFLWFVDTANRAAPDYQVKRGLVNNGSNLCTEITLATTADRTAVCCLSSYNLERHDEETGSEIISDMVRFLDNVIEWFIHFAPPELERAVASAKAERAIGIGFMGWAYYLMKNKIPYEGGGFGSAIHSIHTVHGVLHDAGIDASKRLAEERGEPSDLIGIGKRNSHVFAIAPNVNSSVLCYTSPSCEPLASNAYTQKSRAGISLFKNKYLEKWLYDFAYIRSGEAYDAGAHFDTQDFIEKFWEDIVAHNGSVQHLEYMSDEDKEVFKTAWEIDQHWVVEQAEQRQPYICQAASTNLFFPPGTERAYINSVHLKAFRGRVCKGLYYYRTGSEQTADTIKAIKRKPLADWKADATNCPSCEG